MKKLSAIIIAMALVLGMAQCKKQETPTTSNANDGMVYITVNVDNGGGRHHIEPSVGAYVFTNGDALYVGNDGHYVGTLTYSNGTFSGTIDSPVSTDYLHFYFLGGKEPASAPTTNTTDFTINIANQSSNLPILAYGRSTEFYGASSYTTTLRNKCALVKFDLVMATNDAVTVSGMLTEATIDFATPGITPTATTGTMTLYSESETEKWAILLPQDEAISSFTVNIGSKSYTVSGSYSITNNGYINGGIEVVNATIVNLGEVADDYVAQNNTILTGTLSENHKISIAAGATVMLKNVDINGDDTWDDGNHAGITCFGDATIILDGTNKTRGSNYGYPGVFIASDCTLTIRGDGSLTTNGYGGAGIGAGDGDEGAGSCGNIVIKSGNITALGAGVGCAGIGGAKRSNCGNISIEGGTITSNGATGGAGIGGGPFGSCGYITISGGTVTAESLYNGAGIGEGKDGTCGIITIGYGITKVTAKRDQYGMESNPKSECIGKSQGSSNTVTVSVAADLSDTGEGGKTRTIQH